MARLIFCPLTVLCGLFLLTIVSCKTPSKSNLNEVSAEKMSELDLSGNVANVCIPGGSLSFGLASLGKNRELFEVVTIESPTVSGVSTKKYAVSRRKERDARGYSIYKFLSTYEYFRNKTVKTYMPIGVKFGRDIKLKDGSMVKEIVALNMGRPACAVKKEGEPTLASVYDVDITSNDYIIFDSIIDGESVEFVVNLEKAPTDIYHMPLNLAFALAKQIPIKIEIIPDPDNEGQLIASIPQSMTRRGPATDLIVTIRASRMFIRGGARVIAGVGKKVREIIELHPETLKKK